MDQNHKIYRLIAVLNTLNFDMESKVDTKQEKDAMLYAVTGKTAQLEILLAASGIPATWSASDSSCSLLTLAAARGHLETIHWLLERGADPNWIGRDGCALDVAVGWRARSAIRVLMPLTAPDRISSAADKIAAALQEPPAPLPAGESIQPPQKVPRGVAVYHCERGQPSDDSKTPPFPGLAEFLSCSSIVDWGGNPQPVDLYNHGELGVGYDGVKLGDIWTGDRPLALKLRTGVYSLLGLEPEGKTRFDFPRFFLLKPTSQSVESIIWDEPVEKCSDSRIMGIAESVAWEKLAEINGIDDRFADRLIDLATCIKPVPDVWAPQGIRLNQHTSPGDGIVAAARGVGTFWSGRNSCGEMVCLLGFWW